MTDCCFGFFQLTDLLQQYATSFRDPLMLQPPEWFKAFIYCEAFLQLPFFPIAAYAFLKGGGNRGDRGHDLGAFLQGRECFCIMIRGFQGGTVEGWAARAHTSVLPEKAAQNEVCQKQNLVTTGPCQVKSFV